MIKIENLEPNSRVGIYEYDEEKKDVGKTLIILEADEDGVAESDFELDPDIRVVISSIKKDKSKKDGMYIKATDLKKKNE